MHFEKISENCIYVDAYELEPLFGAFGVLMGRELSVTYDAEFINGLRNRYRFLFETFEAIKGLDPVLLFDFIPDVI
ncbi:MAG: hypothetical protein IKS09_08890, partial [Lachnospiraceae bacterium]|nr:hypothetical protein [Lachnospiraceae bacterium]